MFDRVEAFISDVRRLKSAEELVEALGKVTRDLGFSFFALTHHVDVRRNSAAIRLHNYPADWAEWFDREGLGPTDPVHRASHMTNVAFPWSALEEMIPLTPRDRQILELARREGIGDGFTVPANVPGETYGSCSFAAETGISLGADRLPFAQLVGAFAFEAARRIYRVREPVGPNIRLTDRQRECVVWAARGKSDWEIAQILGVSHETIIQHLKQARERYGVGKRTLLAVHALFDGTIAFFDVLRR
jgi:LuxR family quorum-sensing system transcriptional regulator CciR